MKNRRLNQAGIAHLLLIMLVVVIAVAGAFAWRLGSSKSDEASTSTDRRQRNEAGEQNQSNNSDQEQPVLANLGGFELGDFDQSTLTAGDITFSREYLIEEQNVKTPMILFGSPLPKTSPGEPQRINPNFEIHGLNSQLELISAIDGVVVFIKQQSESSDSEVLIKPNESSPWTVSYDHVTDLKVAKGDTVKVGDVLGKAAPDRTPGFYYYEFQVNQDVSRDEGYMYCPSSLLSDEAKSAWQSTFAEFSNAWDTWYGSSVFQENTGGCVKDRITAAESEGR